MRYIRRELEPQLISALFESFIGAEIVKAQSNAGRRRELYYFRDQQGLEVDFVVPGKSGSARLIEAKAARTVTPRDAAPLQRLADAWSARGHRRAQLEQIVVHRPPRGCVVSRALAPGVRALPWQEFVTEA